MKYIRFAFLALAVMLVAGSCTEKFEEMNVDPNNPTSVPATNVLASVLWVHADGNHDEWSLGNEHGSYAGHISKIQYIDEARYQFRESVVNNRWNRFYLLLSDVRQIFDRAVADEDVNMQAVALTYQSYLYEKIANEWGNVPFSKAIMGTEGELLPVYDNQAAIYDGILVDLKTAADLFDVSLPGPGEGDILFGGDVASWQKWCNSLRLRTAIRISNVETAKATGVINEVLGSPANYPIFADVDDGAALMWTTTSPYREPFWENHHLGGRDDHGVATYIIDEMLALNDPRIASIAKPAVSDSAYRGITPGLHPDDEGFDLQSISRIGEMFMDRPDGLTYFQRYSEVLFIIAEALHRGDMAVTYTMTAQEAYEAAITASFLEMERTAAEATTYFGQASVAYEAGAPGLTKIYMQKWLSLFKTHEAWAEVRRTDVPLMPMAPGSVFPGHNRTPFRYPYAQDEKNLNSVNVGAAAANVVDHFWGEQLWWDVRTGVN